MELVHCGLKYCCIQRNQTLNFILDDDLTWLWVILFVAVLLLSCLCSYGTHEREQEEAAAVADQREMMRREREEPRRLVFLWRYKVKMHM